ncbi:hypothetical protein NEOLEDRAFT_1173787 [Neolentinus lepideus HHB14362 ss-1]|uniref:Uncharacterized protein n=1 Tax=Neolentinus lepideus HHB14362 ss-1 TaxID=1314782 RepID=A0A165VXJ0_9AGAM|nr:hypothetical protein NEOLEDRAFT_1173787 [Neolentinus lepideus HHB14362 ss-1]
MASTSPPFYVLVSHSTLSNDTYANVSSTLSHPVIQYQYADDSPLSLLPGSQDEHVLVLDWDPIAVGVPPTGRSLSQSLTVTGVKVTDAPGAGAADEEDKKNDKMYILETAVVPPPNAQNGSEVEGKDVVSILARFKQMNVVLHRALDYPDFSALRTPQPPAAALKLR